MGFGVYSRDGSGDMRKKCSLKFVQMREGELAAWLLSTFSVLSQAPSGKPNSFNDGFWGSKVIYIKQPNLSIMWCDKYYCEKICSRFPLKQMVYIYILTKRRM
jgi:hypothetical protein